MPMFLSRRILMQIEHSWLACLTILSGIEQGSLIVISADTDKLVRTIAYLLTDISFQFHIQSVTIGLIRLR